MLTIWCQPFIINPIVCVYNIYVMCLAVFHFMFFMFIISALLSLSLPLLLVKRCLFSAFVYHHFIINVLDSWKVAREIENIKIRNCKRCRNFSLLISRNELCVIVDFHFLLHTFSFNFSLFFRIFHFNFISLFYISRIISIAPW